MISPAAAFADLVVLFAIFGIAATAPLRRWTAQCAFVLLMVAHVTVAALNVFVITMPGAELDARTFHIQAAQYASHLYVEPPLEPYVILLGTMYKIGVASQFFGELLSVVAFGIACYVFAQLVAMLGGSRHTAAALLLFGLTPAVAVFTSLTQREAFETLLVLVAARAALRMHRGRRRSSQLIVMILCDIGLALLHHGLALFAVVATGIALYSSWANPSRRRRRIIGISIAVLAMILVLVGVRYVSPAAAGALSSRMLIALQNFRESQLQIDARAAYGITIDELTVGELARKLPLMLVHYILEPFPWKIANAVDIVAFAENALRIVILICAVRAWLHSRGELKSRVAILLLMYAILECTWAAGTVNWGTASRHHVPGFGLIVAVGTPEFVRISRAIAGFAFPYPRVMTTSGLKPNFVREAKPRTTT